METINVSNSSMISTIDYDRDEQELIVTFKNGSQYKYFDVPAEEFEALQQSEHVSTQFRNIKMKYRFEKI